MPTRFSAMTNFGILNPFRGHPESERNMLDPALEETIKAAGESPSLQTQPQTGKATLSIQSRKSSGTFVSCSVIKKCARNE
jgi:hypothetical protein